MVAESIPNAAMGITSLIAVAANAIIVVTLVTKTAQLARSDVYVTRASVVAFPPSRLLLSLRVSDCRHASKKTNTSSAPTPRTMKMDKI